MKAARLIQLLYEKKDFQNVTKSPRNKKYPELSIGHDKKGFFCYTHRCRSPSFPEQDNIPIKNLDFVSTTG